MTKLLEEIDNDLHRLLLYDCDYPNAQSRINKLIEILQKVVWAIQEREKE